MKQGVNPAFAVAAIVIVVAAAAFFIWKGIGPRSDGPTQPINMGKILGKDKMAPPSSTGGPPSSRGGANP